MTEVLDPTAKCHMRERGIGLWDDREGEYVCPRCGQRTDDVDREPEFCAMHAAFVADLEETAAAERDRRALERASRLSTADLKALWDSYDGVCTSDPEIDGETVHRLLNERGEGRYCAI